MPPVIRWTRLEPTARSLTMDSGLGAEICDPAWMLARQWQLGEFKGEDAGSPVRVHLQMECTPLTRYLPGGVPPAWFGASAPANPSAAGQRIDMSIPLETVVERERVRGAGPIEPRLAAEAGLHFLRMLTEAGAGAHRAAVTTRFALQIPPAEMVRDPATERFALVMAGRVPDGALLAWALDVAENSAALSALPETARPRASEATAAWQTWIASVPAPDRVKIDAAVASWRRWYATLFSEPSGTASSWVPERLEYELAVSAPTPQREVVLTAPEYTEGRLDWYSFDMLALGSLGAVRQDLAAADVAREVVRRVAIPTPIRYPGMPGARYWEFEDARVDFGSVAAKAQQLAQLVLVEFALVSGDDWFVIPVDIAVGSAATVCWLVVTDTFGERTLVPSARSVDRAGSGEEPVWDMFQLQPDLRQSATTGTPPCDLFLLPAALAASVHGKPIEEVVLLRDEMANMAWAVERVIESPLGRPLDRIEAFHRERARDVNVTIRKEATGEAPALVYRLATDVPDHWLPLYPTRIRPDAPPIRLLRGGRPLGRVLEPARMAWDNSLLINEEEVPREGARVTRTFQHARWIDGSTHLWIGRRKRTGRGEGSSGVRFDVLEPAP